MILSKDEAICLVLGLSAKKEISSITKLNKLLARLNLHLIPINLDFDLNKFGSFNADLKNLESNEYYELSPYEYKDKTINKFILKPEGEQLFGKVIHSKLNKILTEEDFESLKNNINELSRLPASDISNNEHKMLFVDAADRHTLIQKVNIVHVDMLDLYEQIDKIPADTFAGIRLRALIEYCFYLSKYLKEKFMRLRDEYDFDAYMFDYYFLYHIQSIVSFLNQQIETEDKDLKQINKYYQYIINSVKGRYPFSLENKDLHRLVAQ